MTRGLHGGTLATAIVIASVVTGVAACSSGGSGQSATPTTDAAEAGAVVNTDAWPMHPIDGRFRGANALGAADVDGDGTNDYVTNYEFDQRWILVLHPAADADARRSWPHVEIWKPDPLVSGNGKNPESTALGDFDGDGNVDAVGAHGFSDAVDFEGSAPGIHLVWGPPAARVTDEDAWVDGGWVPATESVGHPHWVVAHDVNGDGLTDVAYGGRRHGGGGGYENPDSPNGNGTFTGIAWLEAPRDPDRRRDLSAWQVHHIDADEPSGHGFVFADLDGDGDDDVVDANADFDTPEAAEEVAWWENPGDGTAAQQREWPRISLLREDDFYAKPSVAVGDLDDDGDADLVTQTDRELIVFRNRGGASVEFDTVRLAKPAEAAWRSRPVRLADVDGDGDLDVFAMLIHEDNVLPPTKAAAFLLLNEGDPFTEEGWRFVPVRWGSGTTMVLPGFGEKWDQVDVTDVDGDGDLDVVANCEEWWASPQFEATPFFTPGLMVSSVAVVWFENTLDEPPPVNAEEDGTIRIEAERPSRIDDSSWVERAPVSDDPDGETDAVAAMQAHNGLRPPGDGTLPVGATAGVTYAVDAAGGDYVVWARVFAPSAFGADLGGDGSDSAWLLFDGRSAERLGDDAGGPTDRWTWVRLPGTRQWSGGRHELTLRPRERGLAVDELVLTTDRSYRPG